MTRIHMPVPANWSPTKRKYVKAPMEPQPILFLAGPIRNAPPWHSDAIRIALKQCAEVFIVSPAHLLEPDLENFRLSDYNEYSTFPRQRAWEQHYMYGAAKNGCVMFWLSKPAAEKQFPDKIYAHITMLELGKWIERKKLVQGTRLVIGADEEFPELSTIKFEIETELPGVAIHRSLEETMNATLKTCFEYHESED